MDFTIEVKGTGIDNGDGTGNLDCTVRIDGDTNALIAGAACLIMDIASQIDETVEEVITAIYTGIKEQEGHENGSY